MIDVEPAIARHNHYLRTVTAHGNDCPERHRRVRRPGPVRRLGHLDEGEVPLRLPHLRDCLWEVRPNDAGNPAPHQLRRAPQHAAERAALPPMPGTGSVVAVITPRGIRIALGPVVGARLAILIPPRS